MTVCSPGKCYDERYQQATCSLPATRNGYVNDLRLWREALRSASVRSECKVGNRPGSRGLLFKACGGSRASMLGKRNHIIKYM